MRCERLPLALHVSRHVDLGRYLLVRRAEIVWDVELGDIGTGGHQGVAKPSERRLRDRRVVELGRDTRRLSCSDGGSMGLDVVRVAVVAVRVVGDDHLRPVLAHQDSKAFGRLGEGDVAKHAGVCVGRPTHHPGVPVTEELHVAHLKVRERLVELGQPGLDHLGPVVPGLAWLHTPGTVALFSVGASDKYSANPLFRVANEHAAGAEHLVVGVGMNGHQCEGVGTACRPGIDVDIGLSFACPA